MGVNVVEHDTRELGIVTAGNRDNNLTYSNSTLQPVTALLADRTGS